MIEDINERNDIIQKSIDKLINEVKVSKFSNSEKESLIVLLQKLNIYYQKKISLLHCNENNNKEKENLLKSFITDVLVEINSVIHSNSDVFYFVNALNKKLHSSGVDKVINSKRK